MTTAIKSSTAQWTSPELLVPEDFGLKESRPTKESDCYALGVTIYEVLSGLMSFSEHPPATATWDAIEGERPARPQGAQGVWFTDDLWEMLECCWKSQPSDRITVDAVLLGLEGSTPPFRASSGVGGLGCATNTDERFDGMASSSCMFPSSHSGLVSDHLCAIVELPIACSDDGLLNPPQIGAWCPESTMSFDMSGDSWRSISY